MAHPPTTSLARPWPTALAPVTQRPLVSTAPQTTQLLATEPPETKPSQERLFVLLTLVLGLLLIPMVLWWVWWLCCRTPEKEPPPTPTPKKEQRAKKPALSRRRAPTAPPLPGAPPPAVPAPAPAPPPVSVCPTIIVCCCASRGVCVNRGPEGTFILCNFSHPSCHQVPLMWSPSSDQGSCTNFNLLKLLSAQGPWDPRIDLQPSLDSLPMTYCSQCHHPEAWRARSPSRMLPLLHPPALTSCRPTLSLPPP
ncbi:anthrax toxin receptor-like [Octodon degus]|uniref:Anthrax toxin receptor-like n=1 Tax=Octodon degus TaxID=10160 RepID=A0A6P6DAJ6_OCTDE|nr:anthrax toxin receptor-like [Octodon degus]